MGIEPKSAPQCPPLIGIDVREGVVGTRGIQWLEEKLVGIKHISLEQAAIVTGCMLRHSLERKKDHIPASSRWLRDIVGDEARRYIINVLNRIGAIKPVGKKQHWSSQIPNKYAFADEYIHQPLGELKISDRAVARFRDYRAKVINETKAASPIYADLWDDLQHLTIHESWEQAMPQFRESEWRREWAWLESHDRIKAKDFWFTCPKSEDFPKPGRLYTTFTSTPSALRKYALLHGQPLVEIDVRCSQPFLHASLLAAGDERDRYLESVGNGTFYEDIGKAGGISDEISRDKLKEMVFADIFYGKNRPTETSPMMTVFAELYPKLTAAIRERKTGNHNRLSKDMQYLEAEIILHNAIPRIRERVPGIRILTVHDAIYIPEGWELIARREMTAAFNDTLGFTPSLRAS
jgi:hypothetical protein